MKTPAMIFIFAIMATLAHAQVLPADKDTTFRIAPVAHGEPMILVLAGERKFQIASDAEHPGVNSKDIVDINPSLIKTISVLKGHDALVKYGTIAQNGAVIIELEKDAFEKLPAALRSKFRNDQ